MSGTSIKTSSIKDLLKSFEEQLGRKLTSEDFKTIKLDQVDPLPLSGEFNFSITDTKALKEKIAEENIDTNDISIGKEATNQKPKKPKM